MLTLDLSPEVEELLDAMAKATGRAKEEIARRALLDALEDYEDYTLAEERIRTSTGERISWEEVKAMYLPDEERAK
jgi:RHH-type rel operon transcriptional repressor/antitoxin RelB